jgi:ABC-type Zn uptake system ZnuABC Zn-binding protein ZnuA
MKRLLAALLLLASPALAETSILTGHPATTSLATALTKGSEIKIVSVVPATIPMPRQRAFLEKRGADVLDAAALTGTAVITLRSAWAEDPLYPLARRANIRLIEIDAARPVDEALPGLPRGPYPWMGPINLTRMADILAGDLRRLVPDAKPVIDANNQALKLAILAKLTAAETALLDAPSLATLGFGDRFQALATDLGLEMTVEAERDDAAWSPEALATLKKKLATGQFAVALHARPLPPAVAALLSEAKVSALAIDTGEVGTWADPVGRVDSLLTLLVKTYTTP